MYLKLFNYFFFHKFETLCSDNKYSKVYFYVFVSRLVYLYKITSTYCFSVIIYKRVGSLTRCDSVENFSRLNYESVAVFCL